MYPVEMRLLRVHARVRNRRSEPHGLAHRRDRKPETQRVSKRKNKLDHQRILGLGVTAVSVWISRVITGAATDGCDISRRLAGSSCDVAKVTQDLIADKTF
jgi:hypothetical protein